MATYKRQFTLRTEEEIFDKISHIAKINKRSIAMQIEFLIEEHIREFEKEKGPIKIDPKEL